MSKGKVEHKVYVLPSNRVRFMIGNRAFTLGYDPIDEEGCTARQQAEWMAEQLRKALDTLAGSGK